MGCASYCNGSCGMETADADYEDRPSGVDEFGVCGVDQDTLYGLTECDEWDDEADFWTE